MIIMNPQGSMILNSDFVERFLVVEKPDVCLIIASYHEERQPVTIARYKDMEEAKDTLVDLFGALREGQYGYFMPDSKLFYEQETKRDARTKRKGGS